MMVFVVVLLIIVICCILLWCHYQKYNQAPLAIETFDGLNSPFHPSVLFFDKGWSGWRYWMVETPFSPRCKPYVDRNECPSIHVSNDGIHWSTPEGLINPLVNFGLQGEKNLDYYSDPHLVLVNGHMECWYRLTERFGDIHNRSHVSLRRVTSNDGILWSEEEIIAKLWTGTDDEGLGKVVVSPSLIYSHDRGYVMWYVNIEHPQKERGVFVSVSMDGLDWSDAQLCLFNRRAVNPWHIDVIKDGPVGFLMTVYDYHDLSLWKSEDGVTWEYVQMLLTPSNVIGSFYGNGLYRSCLIHDDINYKLYFSAFDSDSTYIGLAELDNISGRPRIYSLGKNRTFGGYLRYLIQYQIKHILFIVRNLYRRSMK